MSATVSAFASRVTDPTPAADLWPPPSAPLAVARRIVDLLYQRGGSRLLHHHRGAFYQWNGRCWPETDLRDVRASLYKALEDAVYREKEDRPFAPSRRKVDDVLDALKAITQLDSKLESPAWTDALTHPPANEVVAMENGLLHVPTRTLLPHTPAFFAEHALPFAFHIDAPTPTRWLDFLMELWPDDADAILGLQEALGYLLAGGTEQQKIILLVGPKRSGKGTIARVLTGLMGAHQVAAPTLASLATNFGMAPLLGKRLAVISDARLSSKADSKVVVERLLTVSGQDSITIDRKFREQWTGYPPSRFLVLTNELPRLSDASGALASRMIPFVLERSFFGRENPRLTSELLAEAPSIFTWCLDGLDRMTARGYLLPPESGRDAMQQLEDLSSPIAAFLRERCAIGPDCEVEVGRAWKAWKAWCEDENRHPGTHTTFGRDLKAALPSLKRRRPREDSARVYHYVGFTVNAAETVGVA